MALRAVIDHPKFTHLKHLLGMKKYEALGLLESLWHFTGKYAPQGNVGKFSDTEIEIWLEWGGKAGAAIQALVDSRWLDRDGVHRLVVHDWQRHADDATRKALSRNKLEFVSPTPESVPTCRDMSGHIQEVSGPPVACSLYPEFKSFKDSCAEPSKSMVHAPPSDSPVVIEFPVKAKPKAPHSWPLHRDKLREYEQTFAGLDVIGELRKARQWCVDNPSKQKTAGGMARFLFSWLERTNNRGGGGTNGNGRGRALGVASTGVSSFTETRTPEQIADDNALAMLRLSGDRGFPDDDLSDDIKAAFQRMAKEHRAELDDGRWYETDPDELPFK